MLRPPQEDRAPSYASGYLNRPEFVNSIARIHLQIGENRLHKGLHLLVDCRDVDPTVCADDGLVLDALAEAARESGAEVLSQVRYRFGDKSPPGFTAVVLLDESHCSAHSYADLRLMAIDIFTCGDTNPYEVLKRIQSRIDLGNVTVRECSRFPLDDDADFAPASSFARRLIPSTDDRS